MRRRGHMAAGLIVLATISRGLAHDSPGDVIHLLSDRMETQGPSARLLTSRAYEHQSMGQWDAAVADFRQALKLQPGYAAAILGCAEAMLQQGAYSDAECMVRSGVAANADDITRAPFQAVLARVLAAQLRWSEAREAWRAALRTSNPEVDWYLGEAECLARMGRFDEQVDALAEAVARNPSVVLQRSWVRALVDAGRFDRASKEIESALAGSRWKSTWWLLRARINRERGDLVGQRRDAAAALAEIRSRMHPDRPAPHLLAEMARAIELLDEH